MAKAPEVFNLPLTKKQVMILQNFLEEYDQTRRAFRGTQTKDERVVIDMVDEFYEHVLYYPKEEWPPKLEPRKKARKTARKGPTRSEEIKAKRKIDDGRG